jgi:hypothetical protein
LCAAREAVDTAQVADATESDGVAAAHRFLDAAGNLSEPQVTVTRDAETVSVDVIGRAPRLLPGFDWRVTAHAEAQVERFVPELER